MAKLGVGGVQRWNCDDTILNAGLKKTGLGADALALTGEEAVSRFLIGRQVGDVMKHPAKFLIELLGR